MNQKDFYDIAEVCKLFDITSRTLRFYEEKGIIQSTKSEFSSRRRYSKEQVDHIRNILILRAKGLSVSKIKRMQEENAQLSDVIAESKAELIAQITAKSRELRLLTEALDTIEDGGDIFEKTQPPKQPHEYLEIAEICTEALLSEDYGKIFSFFSETLKAYLPLSAFRQVIFDMLRPLGSFVQREKIQVDNEMCNVVYSYLKYEKLGMYIKFVFRKQSIHGIWLNYYET